MFKVVFCVTNKRLKNATHYVLLALLYDKEMV